MIHDPIPAGPRQTRNAGEKMSSASNLQYGANIVTCSAPTEGDPMETYTTMRLIENVNRLYLCRPTVAWRGMGVLPDVFITNLLYYLQPLV